MDRIGYKMDISKKRNRKLDFGSTVYLNISILLSRIDTFRGKWQVIEQSKAGYLETAKSPLCWEIATYHIITYMKTTPIQNTLLEHRKKTGLTQLDVAQELGLKSTDRISRWEQGLTYPHVGNLARMARLYGVSMDELYPSLGI